MVFEKTSMEFVSFDAQDVITTSGESYLGTSFQILGSDANAYNDANVGLDLGQTTGARIQGTTKYFKYLPNADKNGNYLISAESKGSKFDDVDYTWNSSDSAEIMRWLKENNKQ